MSSVQWQEEKTFAGSYREKTFEHHVWIYEWALALQAHITRVELFKHFFMFGTLLVFEWLSMLALIKLFFLKS